MASVPFTCCPVARHTTCDPQVLRLLLLRRLWLPLPSSSRVCRCGRPLDSSGHHRAAFVAGVLGSRGFAVESAAARVCREAGGRVSTNIRIQDMDIVAPNLLDERRVEVLADGLPLFHGQQLAIDTTLVSALGRDGLPRPLVACAHVDGAILEAARQRKERHYPELGRTRLVVLAAEVGGRWSEESVRFLVQLAKAKVRHEPKVMRVSAQCAWMRRWRCMLASAAAQAFALSLLERRAGLGSDGPTPTTSDVVGDCRHFGAEVMRT